MKENERTPLDEALETARIDPRQANYFYDTLLNAALVVPVQVVGATPSNRRIEPNEKFQPLFLNVGDTKTVPVFDGRERMRAWANPKPLDFLELRGHLFLGLLAADVAIALNPGTPWAHFIDTKTLELLRKALKPVTPV